MSLIYLAALIAVSAAVITGLAEALWSVSQRPAWSQPTRALTLVRPQERRTQNLPFVGVERRRVAADPHAHVEKLAA